MRILLLGWFTAGVIGRPFSLTLSPGSCGPKLEHPLKAVLFFNGMLVAVIVASG